MTCNTFHEYDHPRRNTSLSLSLLIFGAHMAGIQYEANGIVPFNEFTW